MGDLDRCQCPGAPAPARRRSEWTGGQAVAGAAPVLQVCGTPRTSAGSRAQPQGPPEWDTGRGGFQAEAEMVCVHDNAGYTPFCLWGTHKMHALGPWGTGVMHENHEKQECPLDDCLFFAAGMGALGAFLHSAGTAPMITLFIPGTPLNTTPLQKDVCSIQNSIGGAEFRTLGPVASIRLKIKSLVYQQGECRVQNSGPWVLFRTPGTAPHCSTSHIHPTVVYCPSTLKTEQL